MTVADALKKIQHDLTELTKLVLNMRAGGGGGSGPHNVLSATHTDSVAASVVRGDIVRGNSTPKWERLAKGSSGDVLQCDATDAKWGAIPAHASRHQSGGADSIKLDDLASPDNNTDLNVSSSAHGLCPITPNDPSKWLRGDGTWQPITSGGSNVVKLWCPDALPASPSAQDDHFDDGSLDAKWTEWDNGGLLTISEADTFAKFTLTSDANVKWSGMYQTLPAGDCTIILRIKSLFKTTSNYLYGALALFQDATSASGDIMVFYNGWGGGVVCAPGLQRWNQWDSWGGNYWNPGAVLFSEAMYLRVRRNGTNWYWDVSCDGLIWQLAWTVAESSFYTPAQFGIIGANWNTGATEYIWADWISYKNSDDFNPPGRLLSYWVS